MIADARSAMEGLPGRASPVLGDDLRSTVSGLVLNFTNDPVRALAAMARVPGPAGPSPRTCWDYDHPDFLLSRFSGLPLRRHRTSDRRRRTGAVAGAHWRDYRMPPSAHRSPRRASGGCASRPCSPPSASSGARSCSASVPPAPPPLPSRQPSVSACGVTSRRRYRRHPTGPCT